MAFRPLNFEEGRLVRLPTAASITFTKGNACVDNGVGLLTNAAAATAVDVKYIAAETVTTGASTGDLVDFYKVDETVRVSADCDAAPAQTDVGTMCDLAAAASLNPDASTNDLFFIESIDLSPGAVGTSTVVTGYFVHGTPNS
jgi:hypothetical protein